MKRPNLVNICRADWSKALLSCWFEVLCSRSTGLWLQYHRNISRVLPQETSHRELLDSVPTSSSVFNHQVTIAILRYVDCWNINIISLQPSCHYIFWEVHRHGHWGQPHHPPGLDNIVRILLVKCWIYWTKKCILVLPESMTHCPRLTMWNWSTCGCCSPWCSPSWASFFTPSHRFPEDIPISIKNHTYFQYFSDDKNAVIMLTKPGEFNFILPLSLVS